MGALFLASQDVDRAVATIAYKVWENVVTISEDADGTTSLPKHISLDDVTRSSLTSFIQRAALDPNGVYTSFNPVAPIVPSLTFHQAKKDDGSDQTPRSKVDEHEESEQDREARLRIGALGALRWLLGK